MSNYIVSARKYRPQTFAAVVGQGHITATLKNAIERGQLAHAYLFCGPRGVGKTTCARIFAKAINCLNPVDNEACGRCESCLSFNEGRSFNIHELDAASNNSVEDIRSLTDQVRIPPQLGRYSLYIIDEVHMLSAAAFNAFLKTLEEPPAHAIFILATTEKQKIIPTILSRCQIFDFNRIRTEDGVGYLRYIATQEGVVCDDESLHLIARKADGAMRDALSMFDKAVSFCGTALRFREVAQTLNVLDYDTYFTTTHHILEGDYRSCIVQFDEVLRHGFSGQIFVSGLAAHFRDLLMCKDSKTASLLEVTGTLLDSYKAQSVLCDVHTLFQAISILTAVDIGLKTSSNQRLNVELGLMKLCGLGQKKNDSGTELVSPADFPLAGLRREDAAAVKTESAPVRTGSAEESVVAKPAEEAAVPEPVPVPERLAISISGSSIVDILNARPAEEETAAADEIRRDPLAEKKILEHKERFVDKLRRSRPRLAIAFSEMTVNGGNIEVAVPNAMLSDEIARNRAEITELLSATAGINGALEINVTVRESADGIQIIKIEDKLRHLSERNPALAALRRELDLDAE